VKGSPVLNHRQLDEDSLKANGPDLYQERRWERGVPGIPGSVQQLAPPGAPEAERVSLDQFASATTLVVKITTTQSIGATQMSVRDHRYVARR